MGSYDDFTLTAMSNQSNSSGFIEKSQREKKELLAQFLDMNVFEDLYQIANDEIRELSALLKDYKKQNFTDKLVEAKEDLEKNQKVLVRCNDKISKLKDKRTLLREEKDILISELKNVDDTIIDTDSLIRLKNSLELEISDKSSECTDYKAELDNISTEIKSVSTEYQSYDLNKLQESHIKYQTYVNRLEEITSSLDTLNTDIEHKQEHLDGIGSLSFDDDCEHCVKNKNTPFAKQSKTLSDDIIKLTSKSKRLSEEILDMKSDMFKFDVREVLVSVNELKDKLIDLLQSFVTNPIVTIQLENFRVTVLGEVKSPGVKNLQNGSVSIPEVIGMAGDLTIQGKRKNILLIRKNGDKVESINLDITDKSIFNSPYYYVAQNDIIYVEPNRAKVNSSAIGTTSSLISVISALLSLIFIFTR